MCSGSSILLNGLPLNIVDTAGLRDSEDEIEQEGVRRAWAEIEKADLILFVVDATESDDPDLRAIFGPSTSRAFPRPASR